MATRFFALFLLSILYVSFASAQGEGSVASQFTLEHSFDNGATWSPRGSVSVSLGSTTSEVPRLDQRALTNNQKAALASSTVYLLKARDSTSPRSPLLASVPTLINSGLNDTITFVSNAEQTNAVAISYSVARPQVCDKVAVTADSFPGAFTTKVEISIPKNGARANLDVLREAQEREAEEKKRQQENPEDKQTFFGKWWPYIMAFGLVYLFSGVMNGAAGAAAGAPGGGR